MVSLPRCGSLCHLRWQQPTGLTLPCAPAGVWGRVPVAQSSRRALAAPAARSAPHLRVALAPSGPSAHRAHASLRCPKPYAAAFSPSVASARRAQETRLSPKSWVFQRSEIPRTFPGDLFLSGGGRVLTRGEGTDLPCVERRRFRRPVLPAARRPRGRHRMTWAVREKRGRRFTIRPLHDMITKQDRLRSVKT